MLRLLVATLLLAYPAHAHPGPHDDGFAWHVLLPLAVVAAGLWFIRIAYALVHARRRARQRRVS
jgi:hypothetical protein